MPLANIHDEALVSRQAGFTLVEAVLSLSLMAVMAVGIGEAINRNSNNIGLAGVASQMAELRTAADRYVQDNFTTLVASAAGGPVEIPVATLISGNYLPSGFSATNLYQQTYHIYLRERSSTVLESMVVPTGGKPLSVRDGGEIAMLLKGAGGYVPQGGVNALGTRGSWQLALASIVPGSAPNPSGAAVAYQIHYSVYGPTGALIRYATGNPVDNQMATTLNMNGNAINNAGVVNGTQFVSAGAGTEPSVIATTPNYGTNGGIRLQGNPTTNVAYFQVTDKGASTQWGVAAITPDGLWNWSGTINAANVLINGQPIGGSIPSGVIVATAGGSCPAGWSAYSAANDRVIVGAGGQYATGQTGGSDRVTLSVSQMPAHQHHVLADYRASTDFVSATTTVNRSGWQSPSFADDYNLAGSNVPATLGLSESIGGGQPFDNRQQYVALNYCQKN